MLEDIIEQLFSLIDIVLDGVEDALLLLEFLVELFLPLVVQV